MGAPGFWDDQERAAKVSRRARARSRGGSRPSGRSRRDVEDLEALVELAEEDEALAAELDEQLASRRGAAGRARGGAAVLRPATTPATRSSRSTPAPAAPTRRTGPRWSCACMMRWAERRGFKVELLEASAGEEAGHQVRDLPRRGRERLRPVRRREGRAPARADLAVRLRQPPPDVFAGVEVAPVVEDVGDDRDRRRRPADRHLPRLGRGRPARQQDRLRGAHHPPPERASSCSARTSARSPPTGTRR